MSQTGQPTPSIEMQCDMNGLPKFKQDQLLPLLRQVANRVRASNTPQKYRGLKKILEECDMVLPGGNCKQKGWANDLPLVAGQTGGGNPASVTMPAFLYRGHLIRRIVFWPVFGRDHERSVSAGRCPARLDSKATQRKRTSQKSHQLVLLGIQAHGR